MIEQIYRDLHINSLCPQYSNSSIKNAILSSMTNSEIMDIIYWLNNCIKHELFLLKKELRMYKKRDSKKLLRAISQDKQDTYLKIIKSLQWTLDIRNPYCSKKSIDLDSLKSFDIIELICSLSNIDIPHTRSNIRCILPQHKDNTASMHIYNKTNTFYCQWCHRGGTTIDFIKHFFSLETNWEAIKKLNLLINK